MFTAEVDDLKSQMLKAKRQNVKLQGENETLQKKLRRLTESSEKKSKVIDEYNENPPPMVSVLKEEISNLKKNMAGKDILIRNLQKDLDAIKAYYPKVSQVSLASAQKAKSATSRSILRSPSSGPNVSKQSRPISTNRTRGDSELSPEDVPTLATEGSATNRTQIRLRSSKLPTKIQHVEGGCNTSNEKFKQSRLEKFSTLKKEILQSDPEPTDESFSADEYHSDHEVVQRKQSQHEEIKELHSCFRDIVSEMRNLKESLFIIQREQQKTSTVLAEKDANVGRILSDVKDLKKNQIKSTTFIRANNKPNKIYDNDQSLPTKKTNLMSRFNSSVQLKSVDDIRVATKFGRVNYTQDDLIDNFENILLEL